MATNSFLLGPDPSAPAVHPTNPRCYITPANIKTPLSFSGRDLTNLLTTTLQALSVDHPAVLSLRTAIETGTYTDCFSLSQQAKLTALFTSLDTIFFCGMLHPLFATYQIEVRMVQEGTLNFPPNTLGLCISYRQAESTPQTILASIQLHEGRSEAYHAECGPLNPGRDPEIERLACVVGTLLHEMLHAVGKLYICNCGRCKRGRDEFSGATGHGEGWVGVARLLEETFARVVGIRIYLAAENSKVLEEVEQEELRKQRERGARAAAEGGD